MRIEVDQSGKIEDTRVNTVLAYSDNKSYSILIPSIVKREIVWDYRTRKKINKIFFLKLFSACLYLLLKNVLKRVELITIDVEFEGRENDIKRILLNYIRKHYPKFDKNKITFRRIGKKSNAHKLALAVYRNEIKENRIVREREIRELL